MVNITPLNLLKRALLYRMKKPYNKISTESFPSSIINFGIKQNKSQLSELLIFYFINYIFNLI